MLQLLSVRDFAIVDRIEIEFAAGFSVVTGETGAGKSLIVDALSLIAGARGDTSWVREGAARAEIEAEFDVSQLADARAWLCSHELEEEGHACRLRRTLRADGGSRAYINDRSVSVSLLRELASHLIEIHGQHEHQSLLERRRQMAMLDSVAGHDALLSEVAEATVRWRQGERRLAELDALGATDAAAMELMEHQLAELEGFELDPDALEQLATDHRRAAHFQDLLDGTRQLTSMLEGGSGSDGAGISGRVAAALALTGSLLAVDPSLTAVRDALMQASTGADDASLELNRYLDRQEADPSQLEEMDRRLTELHALARKHRSKPEHLAALRADLRERCEEVRSAAATIDALRTQQESVVQEYRAAAARLSAARREAAAALSRDTGTLMAQLGMAGGRFAIEIETTASDAPVMHGADSVEMQVSANAGQPLRPLRKVASGGELSRIALALQVAARAQRPAPTLIFDEVDSGIGGAVAEVVGRLLHRLAERAQVLSVTHLAQVAAQADHHLVASKAEQDGSTLTDMRTLKVAERPNEIARMMGGIELRSETLAHARSMLRNAAASAASRDPA